MTRHKIGVLRSVIFGLGRRYTELRNFCGSTVGTKRKETPIIMIKEVGKKKNILK